MDTIKVREIIKRNGTKKYIVIKEFSDSLCKGTLYLYRSTDLFVQDKDFSWVPQDDMFPPFEFIDFDDAISVASEIKEKEEKKERIQEMNQLISKQLEGVDTINDYVI